MFSNNPICLLAQLYFIAIIGRIILSWFPARGEGGLATVSHALHRVTEPVLGPVRRILPPLGGFDLSPIVVILGLEVLVATVIPGCRIGF